MQFMEQRESEAALLQELEDRGNSKHIGVTHALSFFQILERSLARTLIFSLAPWTLIWRQGLSWLSPGSIPLGAPVAGAEDCRDQGSPPWRPCRPTPQPTRPAHVCTYVSVSSCGFFQFEHCCMGSVPGHFRRAGIGGWKGRGGTGLRFTAYLATSNWCTFIYSAFGFCLETN